MNEQLNSFCQYVQNALDTDGVVYDPTSLKLKSDKKILKGNIIGLALIGKYNKEEAEIISNHTSEDGVNKLLDLRTEQAIYILEAEKTGLLLNEILKDYKKVQI